MNKFSLSHFFLSRLIPTLHFDDPAGGAGAQPPATPPPPEPGKGNVSMTQEEFDKRIGDRAVRASAAKEKEILDALGLEKIDDLKAIVQAARQADDKNKTETQKLQDEIGTLKKDNEKIKTDAETRNQRANDKLIKSEVELEATKLGFLPDAISDVWLLVKDDRTGIEVNEDTLEVTGVEAAVKKIAETRKHWLASKEKKPTAPPRRPANGKDKSDDEGQRQPTTTIRL
jgi:hypothetical protein